MRVRLLLGIPVAVVAAVFAGPLAARPEGTVEGVIRDAMGRPIPGVWIVREGHRDRVGGVPWTRSGPDGRFRVEEVPEGQVRLRVVPGEKSLAEGELVRTAAGSKDLVVVLDPGPQVFLHIADYVAPKGEPRYARLFWEEKGGKRVTRYAPIGADGRTRFVRLPKDRDLEVWALAAADRPVRSAGLRAGDEEIRLAPVVGCEIRGKVLVAKGDSLGRVGVDVILFPGFRVGRATVAADGTFVVSELPEGTYRVTAAFTAGEISPPVHVDAKTGATDLVLDLRR
jgi:hypothetical protein